MASQALYRPDAGSNRGLDATIGFDYSPGDVSRENVQITAGARINAPFARRPQDRIGIGFVYSKISDPFRNFGTLLGGAPLGSEKAFELNYSLDRKSTRLNSSHQIISYAVFSLKKKKHE